MVLGRNDKRKRKEGDLVDLMDPLSESPKRTKVHAQRKFAQGAATVFSPAPPLVKEKEKPKPAMITELITHKRPNTEDFLTFLCFRGTSILPPSLNFFNVGSRKDKLESKGNSSKSTIKPTSSTTSSSTSATCPLPTKTDTSSTVSSSKPATVPKSSASVKKKIITNVQPPKTLIKYKNATSTVQALKKKYQEQRLAKQRIKNKFKASCVMRTRSSTERTVRKSLTKIPPARNVIATNDVNKKRHGLRSGGLAEKAKKSKLTTGKVGKTIVAKAKKRPIVKEQTSESSDSEIVTSDIDDDDEDEEDEEDDEEDEEEEEEEIVNRKNSTYIRKTPSNKALQKKICTRSKSEMKRITRSQRDSTTSKQASIARRPSRKTKEAAAVYMEILGRKLVSPDIDNDDNLSVDSFPELPNARRTAQAENEIRAKSKAAKSKDIKEKDTKERDTKDKDTKERDTKEKDTKEKDKKEKDTKEKDKKEKDTKEKDTKIKDTKEKDIREKDTKEKDSKIENAPTTSKTKTKPEKPILKSKRTLRVRRYCELDSEDESEISIEPEKPKHAARRFASNVEKPTEARSLRSTARKQTTKLEKPAKMTKEKVAKPSKVMEKKHEESEEEETLGSLLKKIMKKREEKNELKKSLQVDKPLLLVEKKNETIASNDDGKNEKLTIASSQVSDDEESFRGFTKKAISKVLSSNASANLLANEEARCNLELLNDQETPKMEILSVKKPEELDEKLKIESSSSSPEVESSTIVNTVVENPADTLKNEEESSSLDVTTKLPLKCHHATENKNSSLNLHDMQLTDNHVRKARVNMSTEQIEKWLNDSSMAREKSDNKTERESPRNFHFEIPEKLIKTENNHLSIPSRIQHLVRPVNVTIPKLMEKSAAAARERATVLQNKIVTNFMPLTRFPIAKPLNIPIPNRNKINADIKEIIKGRSVRTTRELSTTAEDESDAVSKSDQNSIDDSSPEKKSTPEKKPIFQQRKTTFLPRVKERKTAQPSANAFSPENESSVYAFESDTEQPINTPFRRKLKQQEQASNDKKCNSVKSEATDSSSRLEIDESTRFNDQATSSSNNSEIIDSTKISTSLSKICTTNDDNNDKFVMPKSFGNISNVQVLPLGKMPTEWGSVNCSASIAVQVNFDEQTRDIRQTIDDQQKSRDEGGKNEEKSAFQNQDLTIGQQKCTEISTQTENTNDNESDNDGHVFYIPLQSVGRNGPNLVQGQQLIQGVAVKLGTEGPNGPNQRVLLRAQLVTKPPMAIARCPPVGTVQPTTRNPPNSTGCGTNSVVDHPYAVVDPTAPSTSAIPLAVGTQNNTDFSIPLAQSLRNIISTSTAGATRTNSVVPGMEKSTTKSPKATRERKASVDSTKTGTKRASAKSRQKISDIMSPSNTTVFPCSTSSTTAEARLVEAPTFHPTEKDFQDPLEYIDKIRSIAEKFGICRVVPPANFKPECKVSDDMRFTAYNQYVHRMLHRWGPNVKEMMAIKKYLATQSITLTHPPWIGGMEVDLPHLYQTVQSLGGLKEVIEKKKWQKVADGMKIPKSAQDRVTKLDDIYCKYLLPYDTLSPEERGKLFDDVEEDWKKRETKTLQRLDGQSNDNDEEEDDDSSDEIEECIIKGRNMPLNAFYRIARNTQRMWFGENQRSGSEAEGASAIEVEAAFWKHVAERKRHVCVHAASIDSSGRGFGFSVVKNSPFARHPWNLKVLTNNAGSVLRALGPLMGVTVPTLHVGMLFSACCWYRDPHGLPWIEYLHTGAKKIWYGIPDEHNNNFREALSKMVPRYCKKKTIWLPSDTAMVPPELLVNNGVPLCRTVQEPGQFIIVFPKAFTSSICTGYVVSESVYFAQPAWLENAEQVFKDLQDSCEPSIFSFERLLFSIINDSRSHYDVLKQIMPAVVKIRERELEYRKQLEYIGLTDKEKLPLPGTGKGKKGKRVKEEDGDFECETCRANLFVSLVNNSQDDSMYCLPHALQLIVRKKQVLKNCTLMYTYTEEELDDLIHKLEDRIEAKSKKANQIRQSK